MPRDILQAPLKLFGHGNEVVTVSLAALTVLAIQAAQKTEQTEHVKGVGSICEKANLTAKVCTQVQTALLGAGKDEIMFVGGGNYPMGERHIRVPV